jgi:hypothetical protein
MIGYESFISEYSHLVANVVNNIYAVPKYDSIIDFTTYTGIMASTGLGFTRVTTPVFLKNIEGAISTDEKVIDYLETRKYFKKELGDRIYLNTRVDKLDNFENSITVNGDIYDYAIDCTWGHFNKHPNVFFEVSLLLVMESNETFDYSITLVDGELWSLYRTADLNIYTLSSVKFTPLFISENIEDCIKYRNEIPSSLLNAEKMKIINHAKIHMPDILEKFKFLDFQLSIKTKLNGESSDRSCYVDRNKRLITVMSGKIDTIFYAADSISKLIVNEN